MTTHPAPPAPDPGATTPRQGPATFERMWADLEGVGRNPRTGGYRRFAWTPEDHELREWFAGECAARGLDLVVDRAGNQWGWWGNPDRDGPGVVTGSHLDSVPEGGAFDGPLGVVSAFAAVDTLRSAGVERPARPIAVVNMVDEEGARFGIACAGSRIITGQLAADRARSLRDHDGTTMAEAMRTAGLDPDAVGPDPETLRRVGAFVELHVEQGRALADPGHPAYGHAVAVGTGIHPHGRWRVDITGEANHAGTTLLSDRRDASLAHARLVLAARELAERNDCVATMGKVAYEPNGVNAVPSRVTAWLDVRGADEVAVQRVVAELTDLAGTLDATVTEESWTPPTHFAAGLGDRLAAAVGGPGEAVPRLATGAGHDAGVLATAGLSTAMLFVRNPTGVSHSPAEFAEVGDCLAGVRALSACLADVSGRSR